MTMSDLLRIADAYLFAAKKHGDQKRKYTGEAYINHPVEVAEIVASVSDSTETIIGALLHDTVEDTDTTFEEIEKKFGKIVRDIVDHCSDKAVPSDGNREKRTAINRAHNQAGPPAAHDIKLADHISNSKSITEHDPDFAKVYMREIEQSVHGLTLGHPVLRIHSIQIITAYKRSINSNIPAPSLAVETTESETA